MNLSNELEKLSELRRNGDLSEKEYQQAKTSLLNQPRPAEPLTALDSNTWGAMIHLSQFCAYLLPLAGIIVPLILWQIKKDESAVIDRHGKIVMNWLLTQLILWIIAVALAFVLIGFPLMFLISIVAIVFPIIGAVKAAGGEIWPYPCSIRFFN